MASIYRAPNKRWKATIRKVGFKSKSKTFDKFKDAQQWVRQNESSLEKAGEELADFWAIGSRRNVTKRRFVDKEKNNGENETPIGVSYRTRFKGCCVSNFERAL